MIHFLTVDREYAKFKGFSYMIQCLSVNTLISCFYLKVALKTTCAYRDFVRKKTKI